MLRVQLKDENNLSHVYLSYSVEGEDGSRPQTSKSGRPKTASNKSKISKRFVIICNILLDAEFNA